MDKRTATVEISEQGRLYVPKSVRRALGIDGEKATLEIDVGVVED